VTKVFSRSIPVLLAAIAALALPVLSSPAQAAPSTPNPAAVAADGSTASSAAVIQAMADCPSSYFCVWKNSDFNDGPGKWQNAENNYGSWSHASCAGGTWNNCASSVYNHGNSYKVSFFDGTNQTGAFFYRLPAASYLANLALNTWSDGTSPNDKISSHNWHAP
jgi:peptidase inhibitor family I36